MSEDIKTVLQNLAVLGEAFQARGQIGIATVLLSAKLSIEYLAKQLVDNAPKELP